MFLVRIEKKTLVVPNFSHSKLFITFGNNWRQNYKKMLIVGIAGGTGSGKTTVVNKLMDVFPNGEIIVIPQDAYYKDSGNIPLHERQKINFDHPDSLEFSLLIEQLNQLKKGKSIEMPIYSYLTCLRSKETITVNPARVVLVEGILILADPGLRKMLDIKVFVDADADDRLGRAAVARGSNPALRHTGEHARFIGLGRRYPCGQGDRRLRARHEQIEP